MGWFNNSFNPMIGPNDIKIEFDEGAYFEVIDPDSGETKYLLISALIGQETSKTPGVGDYILEESKILPEPEVKEEKKSLWEIDLDDESFSWDKAIDKFCEVGEIYPITSEELEKTLSIVQDGVYEASGIDWEDNWLL